MANEETDKLDLITITTVNGGMFGKTIKPTLGFSKELFQNGQHIGSICAPQEMGHLSPDCASACAQLSVRNEATLATVNLGPRTLTLTGKLYTNDGYAPSYEMCFEIRVHNPLLFTQRYIQRSDPIALFQSALQQEFDAYAARTPHDQLNPIKLRHDISYSVRSKQIGILVTNIYKSSIYIDPERARVREIERTTEIKKVEIEHQHQVSELQETLDNVRDSKRNDHQRREKQKDRAVARQDNELDQDSKMRQLMQATLGKQVIDALLTTIKQDLDEGDKNVYDLLADPRLSALLPQLLPPGQPQVPQLPQGNPSQAQGGSRRVKQEGTNLPSAPKQSGNAQRSNQQILDAGDGDFIEIGDDE